MSHAVTVQHHLLPGCCFLFMTTAHIKHRSLSPRTDDNEQIHTPHRRNWIWTFSVLSQAWNEKPEPGEWFHIIDHMRQEVNKPHTRDANKTQSLQARQTINNSYLMWVWKGAPMRHSPKKVSTRNYQCIWVLFPCGTSCCCVSLLTSNTRQRDILHMSTENVWKRTSFVSTC